MQSWACKFYSSVKWQKCRESYSITQHRQCEKCGNAGDMVHHIIPLTISNISNPEITLSFGNLQLLCRECHGREHGTACTIEGVSFDEWGNPVYTPPVSI